LQAAQKDLRGEAREKSMSEGVLNQYVGARQLSAPFAGAQGDRVCISSDNHFPFVLNLSKHESHSFSSLLH
jgi:hypothetical protein